MCIHSFYCSINREDNAIVAMLKGQKEKQNKKKQKKIIETQTIHFRLRNLQCLHIIF